MCLVARSNHRRSDPSPGRVKLDDAVNCHDGSVENDDSSVGNNDNLVENGGAPRYM